MNDKILDSIDGMFRAITTMHSNFTLSYTKPNTNERHTANLYVSLYFIKYEHQKDLSSELDKIVNLKLYESQIRKMIATGLLLYDNQTDTLSSNVWKIQEILLDMLPPESTQYKQLLADIPEIAKFKPGISQ
jgi:hypothetical protein